MAHCGYEPTAADMTISHPLKALKIALFGVKTEGPMAPEISLANQRPAKYNFAEQVEKTLTQLNAEKAQEGGREGPRGRGRKGRRRGGAAAPDRRGISRRFRRPRSKKAALRWRPFFQKQRSAKPSVCAARSSSSRAPCQGAVARRS